MNKVEEILKYFNDINSIPRRSKNERAISDYLYNWADDNGFEVERDELLNILIRVPGTPGYEKRDVVVIQGHMDMVCEKLPESDHDFTRDPINMYRDGEWLKAKGTTLGADNGIAIAMAMKLITDRDVSHPPLELLFTVDEETGLTGAVNLKANWLRGKRLINIDSEDEGVFTIGCAGGRDAKVTLDTKNDKDFKATDYCKIVVGGLKGGHSGMDINLEKGNANILLARLLKSFEKAELDYRICDFYGGSAHNAIPRDSYAIIALSSSERKKIEDITEKIEKSIKKEFLNVEPDLFFKIDWDSQGDYYCDRTIIDLVLSLPHGVLYNSTSMKGIVETSSNLAKVEMDGNSFKILMSQRSSVMSRLDEICDIIDSVVRLSGAKVEFGGGYPAWQPDFKSPILEDFKKVYKEHFGKEPIIEVIHAGLECGVIGSKYPGMDMISIGPTIKNPHSPDEKMFIPSVEAVWKLLTGFLKS